MKASQILERILEDHVALRGMLESLENRSKRVLDGERNLAGALRVEGEALLAKLREHMHWEDVHLAPALRDADAWGEERAERLAQDHREQRELLQHVLWSLQDQSRPAVLLARNLLDVVSTLREDMQQEERSLLYPIALRDGLIGIDVETG